MFTGFFIWGQRRGRPQNSHQIWGHVFAYIPCKDSTINHAPQPSDAVRQQNNYRNIFYKIKVNEELVCHGSGIFVAILTGLN